MNKEELDYLNSELNRLFLRMSKDDIYCHDNFEAISILSDSFWEYLKVKDLTFKNENPKYLTYQEVYDLGRKIIESINPKYLEEYDKLIDKGVLNFSYEYEYNNSNYTWIEKENQILEEINLNRSFDYSEVGTLIHEFIHKTNYTKEPAPARIALTEFFSIYFETYAFDFLEQNGVNPDELDRKERLRMTFNNVHKNNTVFSPLLAYSQFGSLDDNAFELLTKYFIKIDKSIYDEELKNLYETFKNAEKMFLDEGSIEHQKYAVTTMNYMYLIGTLLTYYARKNCTLEEIVYLNDHINEFDNIYDVFRKMKISGNYFDFYDEAISQIDKEFGFKDEKTK